MKLDTWHRTRDTWHMTPNTCNVTPSYYKGKKPVVPWTSVSQINQWCVKLLHVNFCSSIKDKFVIGRWNQYFGYLKDINDASLISFDNIWLCMVYTCDSCEFSSLIDLSETMQLLLRTLSYLLIITNKVRTCSCVYYKEYCCDACVHLVDGKWKVKHIFGM